MEEGWYLSLDDSRMMSDVTRVNLSEGVYGEWRIAKFQEISDSVLRAECCCCAVAASAANANQCVRTRSDHCSLKRFCPSVEHVMQFSMDSTKEQWPFHKARL
jgi:hypothetical protein